MRAVKTENSNHSFGPPDGTPEGKITALPCQILKHDDAEVVRSVWKISDEEREWIANGANIELDVWWIGAFPPVTINVTEEKEIS